MVMAHGVERERAEPEGGQYCDSRWKFLFEETVFSAALLIMCLSSLSVTFGKFSSATDGITCIKLHIEFSVAYCVPVCVCAQCLAHERLA